MYVDSIMNGLVIDHIKAGRGMELYSFLGLEQLDFPVAIIKNVPSSKMGKKDIIKIDADIDINFDLLGYIDSNITVNVIKNGIRVSKIHPTLPNKITNIVKCKNPRCITSAEEGIEHVFRLTDAENRVYRCIYCDTKAE